MEPNLTALGLLMIGILLIIWNLIRISKNKAKEDPVNQALEEFRTRQLQYKSLTAEMLDTTADDELVSVVMYNLWAKMNNDPVDDYETIAQLPPSQLAIYATWQVEAEVTNGGFNQYYYNPGGRFADRAEDSFRLIGAPEFANLMHRANEIYAVNQEEITKEQDGTLEGFSKSYKDNPLGKLDDEFYKLNKYEKLSALMVKFIRHHKMDFVDTISL